MNPFIIDSLRTFYGIEVSSLNPLSEGGDLQEVVYKVHARDHENFFLKIKRSHFNAEIFNLLANVKEVIPPIKTLEGKLSQQVGEFTFVLYPFVDGQDGINRALSDDQWIKLGQALRKIHQIEIPSHFLIRREDFSGRWGKVVRSLFNNRGDIPFLQFLHKNRITIENILERSEELSEIAKSQKQVLCHSDMHGGNVLLDGESIYIVDWDNPILAPKERDLIFIGEGFANVWNKPEETKLFYQGYGHIDINPKILSYYRFERIVQNIAVFAHAILSDSKSQDKAVMYNRFLDMFAENGVIKIAIAKDIS